MMNKRLFFAIFLILMPVGAGIMLRADEYVDDVYAPWTWSGFKTPVESTAAYPEAKQPVSSDEIRPEPVLDHTPHVVFLDDSISRQNPDTVVRAVIRR